MPTSPRSETTEIVWFKRDLRSRDHQPLQQALARGPTLAIFIIEPEWLSSAEFDVNHLRFVEQSLEELSESLARKRIPLLVRYGNAEAVWRELHRTVAFDRVYSHEETGLDWSFQRDIRLKKVFSEIGVQWLEFRQFGVVRGLKRRGVWEESRQKILRRPLFQVGENPAVLRGHLAQAILNKNEWKNAVPDFRSLSTQLKPRTQMGGESRGLKTLISFLEQRGEWYTHSISSPLRAQKSGSRLSPYLAWGNLSMSEVLQAVEKKRRELEAEELRIRARTHSATDSANNSATDSGNSSRSGFPAAAGREKDSIDSVDSVDRMERAVCARWRRSLQSFESRLAWHCHFIQKLESEPEIEFHNMNRAFDGMREADFDERLFEAWCRGETGFPMIDACMRCLLQTGWINFRMRAMLMSFASYQLWLHWKKPAEFLARQFIDFEPGIHYPQVQMQSGVTGINAIRIYSPMKQQLDQDPDGEFVRRYVPELSDLSLDRLTNPWGSSQSSIFSSVASDRWKSYPKPIVCPEESLRQAKRKIFEWRSRDDVKEVSQTVLDRHGSRKNRFSNRSRKQSPKGNAEAQLSLFDDWPPKIKSSERSGR